MQNKTVFNISPISYSQFLQSKEQHIHFLTDQRDAVDIDFFRRSISLRFQQEFATKRWQNWVYRMIFIGFGLLFLVLAMIIFFKTANFACAFFFKNSVLVKNALNIFCLILAAGAFAVGYKIHPEKEAIQYLAGKVERELVRPVKQLQIEFNSMIANLSQDSLGHLQTLWINRRSD